MKETKKEITELLIYEYNPLHLIIFYSLGLSFTKMYFSFTSKYYVENFIYSPLYFSQFLYLFRGHLLLRHKQLGSTIPLFNNIYSTTSNTQVILSVRSTNGTVNKSAHWHIKDDTKK